MKVRNMIKSFTQTYFTFSSSIYSNKNAGEIVSLWVDWTQVEVLHADKVRQIV